MCWLGGSDFRNILLTFSAVLMERFSLNSELIHHFLHSATWCFKHRLGLIKQIGYCCFCISAHNFRIMNTDHCVLSNNNIFNNIKIRITIAYTMHIYLDEVKHMLYIYIYYILWRHQMETFSASLAICAAGNSPVTDESPHKSQWRGALMFSLICLTVE